MVALQRDIAFLGLGKERHFTEFTFGDPRVEIVAAQHVFEIFHTVDFVHAFFRADHEPNMVPFAYGLGGV